MFNPKENILDQQLAESGLELNILGGIKDFFTGGASTRNAYARKQADATNRYNKAAYKFEGKELKRSYEYAVEGQDISKKNLLRDLQYQADTRQQEWNYGMAIRDYEFSQQLKAYNQSRVQALQQKGFNEVATQFANLQADRSLMEQQIELALTDQETLLNYTTQAHGLLVQKKKAKTSAASQLRKTGIEAIKQKGESQARGQAGRTAAKSLNAIQAEANILENDIVNELVLAEGQIDMDLLLAKHQNMQDNLALDLTENNLLASDRLTRQQLDLQRQQSDLDAEAMVLLKPTIAPPLPKPLAMPIPEFQDVYKPKQGPKPQESVPFRENLGSAFVNTALSLVSTGVGIAGGVRPGGS